MLTLLPVLAAGCGSPSADEAGEATVVAPATTARRAGGAAQPQADTRSPRRTVSDQAMREAALAGEVVTVISALDQGADVDAADRDLRTPLMLAAYNGHANLVSELLRRGAEVDLRDATQRTALMYAASGKHAATVELLLDAGADVDAVDGEEGWSALMFAASEGNDDVVRMLLQHGADPRARDVDGETAADFAASNGHAATAELLRGAD